MMNNTNMITDMDIASSGILFDSAAIAAIISALIAIGFLIIREYIIEPKKWKQDQSSWYQGVDLGDMHTLIRKEFNEFRKKYEEMTGHSFEKS